MKRKVIRLAQKTLVISLPSKWAKNYGIKKGDEIEIEENGNELKIKTQKGTNQKNIEIDISGLEGMEKRMLASIYKAGFNEIKILFDKPEKLKLIQEEINKYHIGFEIIEQGKTYCIAKEISSNKELEFENIMRNIFRTIIQIGEDMIESLEKNNYSELENISSRDIIINKFTDFCRRNLNKFQYKEKEKTSAVYYLVEEIEKIGDCYRDLCKDIYQNKKKTTKEVIKILKEINNLFKLSYELFYKMNKDKLKELKKIKEKIEKQIEIHLKTEKEQKQLMIIHTMYNSIFDLNGALIIKSL